MFAVRIHGRGGQGAVTAAEVLSVAAFNEGRHAQAFPTFGSERTGAPVVSFCRIDDRPIRLRCDIERADAILCFDASLLAGRLLASADAGTQIVVNSSRSRDEFARRYPDHRVVPIDGIAIARRHGLGRIVNSALLGALACALGAPGLRVLSRALVDEATKLHDENVAACEEGFRSVEASMQSVAA